MTCIRGIAVYLSLCVLLATLFKGSYASEQTFKSYIKGKEPVLSRERVVFQTKYGDIEFGFFPKVAPVTADHIFKLIKLGTYSGNIFFRIDKGFVAQCSDVLSRPSPSLNQEQRDEAVKTMPLEVVEGVNHVAGVLSMGRYDDPNSGTSSFSILLGSAPHLDMKYTIFGRVTRGMEALRRMEDLPTRREGIFVMPLEPVVIQSVYWRRIPSEGSDNSGDVIETRLTLPGEEDESMAGKRTEKFSDLESCKVAFDNQALELQRTREKCLPH